MGKKKKRRKKKRKHYQAKKNQLKSQARNKQKNRPTNKTKQNNPVNVVDQKEKKSLKNIFAVFLKEKVIQVFKREKSTESEEYNIYTKKVKASVLRKLAEKEMSKPPKVIELHHQRNKKSKLIDKGRSILRKIVSF